MMGAIIGGTSTAGSLGMALGPFAGGWIYDAYATYAWLYLGSFGIGLGAFLIALLFKPFPKTGGAGGAAGLTSALLVATSPRMDGLDLETPDRAVLPDEARRNVGYACGRDERVVRPIGVKPASDFAILSTTGREMARHDSEIKHSTEF